jgi:hypothetical protein
MYPDYQSPSPREFGRLLEELGMTGWTCFPYLNGLVFDERYAPFSRPGSHVAIRSREGETVSYNRSMAYLRYSCPYAARWQAELLGALEALKSPNGVHSNGVYLDMLAAAEPILCWAPDHDHPRGDPYAWQRGVRRLLSEVPGRILVEGNAEIYLDLVDHVLMHLYSQAADAVPLWKLVYGDVVSSVGWTYPQRPDASRVAAEVGRARKFGADSLGTPWMTGVPEEEFLSPPVRRLISEEFATS